MTMSDTRFRNRALAGPGKGIWHLASSKGHYDLGIYGFLISIPRIYYGLDIRSLDDTITLRCYSVQSLLWEYLDSPPWYGVVAACLSAMMVARTSSYVIQ
jgi:hypothetical protein